MSSLDDLRTTLVEHADAVEDRGALVRSVAVRERARGVRRRRRGLVAAVAALVLVGGVAVTTDVVRGPSGPEPAAAPTVAGREVPGSVSVLGHGYDLADTAQAAGDSDALRIRVPRDDVDRVVSLVASGLGGGAATLLRDGDPVARSLGDGGVEAPVRVYAGSTLVVRLGGAAPAARVGLATYAETGSRPAGAGEGEAFFPARREGDVLLGAAFSAGRDPGVRLSYRPSGRPAELWVSCATDQRGLWLQLEVDGRPAVATTCAPGSDGTPRFLSESGGAPGRDHEAELFVTRGADGPRVAPGDGTRLGLAAYDAEAPAAVVRGWGVARTVEVEGREWTSTDPASLGRLYADGRLVLDLTAAEDDVAVGFVLPRGPRTPRATGSLSGRLDSLGSFRNDTGSSMTGEVLLPRGEVWTLDPDGGVVLTWSPLS